MRTESAICRRVADPRPPLADVALPDAVKRLTIMTPSQFTNVAKDLLP